MNKLKFFVFCPDDEVVIANILEAAHKGGAGKIGNYSHCAFIQKGQGNFLPLNGADPTIGTVGEMTRVNEVKIEMECATQDAATVLAEIKKVHPYEEVVIDFIQLAEVSA